MPHNGYLGNTIDLTAYTRLFRKITKASECCTIDVDRRTLYSIVKAETENYLEALKPSGLTNLFASVNLVCMRERELYDKICMAWLKRIQLATSFPQNI